MSQPKIRLATQSDISSIEALLLPYVEEKIILPRSREQLQKFLPHTWVAVSEQSTLMAVASLFFYQPRLIEIRGLAVNRKLQKQGMGRELIVFLIEHLKNILHSEEYKQQNIYALRLFALTFTPVFFEKLGFRIVPKENFPEKIFEVCHVCDLQDNCKEIAVEMLLQKQEQ